MVVISDHINKLVMITGLVYKFTVHTWSFLELTLAYHSRLLYKNALPLNFMLQQR